MEINLATVLWFALFMCAVLTVRALVSRSWIIMWIASLGTLVLSWLGIFSIGALTFLLFCLQVAAAVAIRHEVSRQEWTRYLLVSVSVWIIAVPVQVLTASFFRWSFLGWYYLFPVVGVIGLLLPFLPIGKPQAQPS